MHSSSLERLEISRVGLSCVPRSSGVSSCFSSRHMRVFSCTLVDAISSVDFGYVLQRIGRPSIPPLSYVLPDANKLTGSRYTARVIEHAWPISDLCTQSSRSLISYLLSGMAGVRLPVGINAQVKIKGFKDISLPYL